MSLILISHWLALTNFSPIGVRKVFGLRKMTSPTDDHERILTSDQSKNLGKCWLFLDRTMTEWPTLLDLTILILLHLCEPLEFYNRFIAYFSAIISNGNKSCCHLWEEFCDELCDWGRGQLLKPHLLFFVRLTKRKKSNIDNKKARCMF